MKYFYSVKDNELTYSVDMLRITTYINYFDFKDLLLFFNCHHDMYWTGSPSKIGSYLHNYMFNNIYIGLCTYTVDISKPNLILTFEFNPNKTDFSCIKDFINKFKNNWIIKKIDLAIDLPGNINEFQFQNSTKRSNMVFYNDLHNRTIYHGKGNGHIKIYNKMIESNLEYELTRFEITKEIDLLFDDLKSSIIDFNFLTYIKLPYKISSSQDSTLNAICYALNNRL